MFASNDQANQIAALLNSRNELTVVQTGASVREHLENFLCCYAESGEVIACVEVKRVQWYQCEILHLVVAETYEGKGHAKCLLRQAERIARERNARLLQCTIRCDNTRSRSLFEGCGFSRVGTFFNERSGKNVEVFQKVLTNAA
jgi:ribosomal protein S18 acetylase RimI-like enzyme